MDDRLDHLSLHERRRRKEDVIPVNFSRRSSRAHLRLDSEKALPPVPGQMTPPETPASPHEIVRPSVDEQGLFHNYLRAFCAFDPPTGVENDEDALQVTASIRPGDLVLVHSVHANGWADGTVLTSGERGWIPTNYCEAFEHPFMKNLLNAMTQFWDLLGANEDSNLSTFVRQDYIRGLIAGVRSLLEQADCLHRDGARVQRHTGVRRMRKGLLADLSTLVQIAKRLQDTIGEPFAGEVIHVLLDDLVSKAFRVVTRAVGFVDMWTQETSAVRQGKQVAHAAPVTANASDSGLTIDADASTGTEPAAIDSAKELPPPPYQKHDPALSETNKEERRGSKVFRPQSGLIAHRLSVVRTENPLQKRLASEQLGKAHDICISHIGAFIGLYLHPRPTSELVATTKRLVNACRAMLRIVDEVAANDIQQTTPVFLARTNFQSKLEDLITTTKEAFLFSNSSEHEVIVMPEQSSQLVQVGTSLIRTVGECVVRTRQLIEQIGDFELKRRDDEPSAVRHGEQTGSDEVHEINKSEARPAAAKSPSKKKMPPPPPMKHRKAPSIGVANFAFPSPPTGFGAADPLTPVSMTSQQSLPGASRRSHADATDDGNLMGPRQVRANSLSPARKTSVGASIAGSTDTQQSSMRDSGVTGVSEGSTRATTPDHAKEARGQDAALINSFASLSSLRSVANTETSTDAEQLLQKTYANELTFNKDGQVSGGSLPALVEQLTLHDNAPDPQFLSAFFVTFRMFTTPRTLAQALIERFDYIGESRSVGAPVRLRIYNVFKGWLETYWNADADRDALGDIRFFAMHKLKPYLSSAGERLVELTRKITANYSKGTVTGPLVSGVGKISTSIGGQQGVDGVVPEPIITKTLLNGLRNAATRDSQLSIMDFDPLEIARQLTIIASTVFNEIQAYELLSLEWNNKKAERARNVRYMCTMNTDVAHVVGDTILHPDDAKKRALVIKHWTKVAMRCLDLNNYESLMAIMCSLNSSVVQRLRRTWEYVSKKTRARLDELNAIVDISRNHASLRRRLETPAAPCLPFLGIYLTDLTFADAGNPKCRELPGVTSDTGEPVTVINFDKHLRMAKIVAHVQKYQVPYKLQPIPELQAWLQGHLRRMRESAAEMVGNFHRRSLLVEPRQLDNHNSHHGGSGERSASAVRLPDTRRHTEPPPLPEERPKTAGSIRSNVTSKTADATVGERFDFWSLRPKGTGKVRVPTPTPEEV